MDSTGVGLYTRWIWILILVAASAQVQAHRLRPAVATVTFDASGTFAVTLNVNLEAMISGIEPVHQDTDQSARAPEYNALRALTASDLGTRAVRFFEQSPDLIRASFDGRAVPLEVVDIATPAVDDVKVGRVSVVHLRGAVPPAARSFTWQYSKELGDCALRIATAKDGIVQSYWLTAGASSDPFILAPGVAQVRSAWSVFSDYAELGFTHILPKGLDHILFVVGLFLLSSGWRPLLYQVTAFTVAHSITLALAMYGVLSLPASVVEPLIALSIVYVAIDNLTAAGVRPWRLVVVFAFGLLHGLGFAGVLAELELPRADFLSALLAFNVGVEFGQLAVIGLAWLVVYPWRRDGRRYRRVIAIPGSIAIALVGCYWTIERVAT